MRSLGSRLLEPRGLGGDGLQVYSLLVCKCSEGSVSLSELPRGAVPKQLYLLLSPLDTSLPSISVYLFI